MVIIQVKNSDLHEKLKRVSMMTNGNCGPGACGNACNG